MMGTWDDGSFATEPRRPANNVRRARLILLLAQGYLCRIASMSAAILCTYDAFRGLSLSPMSSCVLFNLLARVESRVSAMLKRAQDLDLIEKPRRHQRPCRKAGPFLGKLKRGFSTVLRPRAPKVRSVDIPLFARLGQFRA